MHSPKIDVFTPLRVLIQLSLKYLKMPADNIDRITRSSSEEDEALIQKIIERVLINPVFLEKLSSAIAEKIACQDKQIKVCEEKVVSLERKVEDLHSELECQQQYSRRNNLRIFGIPLTKDEDTGNVVTKMVKEKLNITLTANDIDWCHRLKQKVGEHPPIIIKFCRRTTRNTIFALKSKLKGSKIHIREDLTHQRASMVKDLAKHVGHPNVFTNQGNIFAKISGKITKISCINDFSKVISVFGRSE